MIDPPRELLHTKDLLPKEGNYLVYMVYVTIICMAPYYTTSYSLMVFVTIVYTLTVKTKTN